MEQGQVEVFHKEGTNSLIQDKQHQKQAIAARHTKINIIIALTVILHIITAKFQMNYPNTEPDFVTQNMRPAAKRFTGGQYFSWGSGLPLT